MGGLRQYGSRAVLPLVLLVAALTTWFIAGRLAAAEPTSIDTDVPVELDEPLVTQERLPEFVDGTPVNPGG